MCLDQMAELNKDLAGHSTRTKQKGKTKDESLDYMKQSTGVDFNNGQEGSRGPSETAGDCRQCQQWCPL